VTVQTSYATPSSSHIACHRTLAAPPAFVTKEVLGVCDVDIVALTGNLVWSFALTIYFGKQSAKLALAISRRKDS
jgi:hypothetical protein